MAGKTDVIVVGGGASGMMAAIACARQHKSVTVLEHNDKLGRKLLATGNGKCNYTNELQKLEFYHSKNDCIVKTVFSQFDKNQTVEFFKELGIYPRIKNGYYYPYSEQASSIVEALRLELERLKVKIKLNEHITSIRKVEDGFLALTESYQYSSSKLILATGGMSAASLGSDGSSYSLLKQLGHTVTKLYPGLAGLRANETCFSKLAGIRVKAKVELLIEGKHKAVENGEVQLTKYGISGIPVFQLSRYVAIALGEKKQVKIDLDFMPDYTKEEVILLLERLIHYNAEKTLKDLLVGFFDSKLIAVLLECSGIKRQKKGSELSESEFQMIVERIKKFSCTIKSVNSFEQSQVTVGGVDCNEVDCQSLESKIVSGMYLTGELLDVDAICGGYNLQWAWSTGYVAGINAGFEKKESGKLKYDTIITN
ncbi:BaiN/RdsA family NAD(P)/FAD-dependent oxidoreductase [Velocimicrobium porci]|uniref:NAD(P)/FAD-dependent oxidoreductase n=1 Tax=Velocimicrobium porci TaxID=2606634 RepID=A0A6L5XYR3_9FIRM|nr:NAD(P)/FAD-dependent oxidoreductase [Velocimicrobium porci]MSS64016.1 NAD(P)/FAD-dependent oxidoreductase [Velocimicrobium porci]